MLTGQLPKIDSMKEVLRHMRISREKSSTHYRSDKAHEKESVVKLIATSVVSFVTEGIHGNEVYSEAQVSHVQICTSPPTVAAAMGNQQIRAQVSDYKLSY